MLRNISSIVTILIISLTLHHVHANASQTVKDLSIDQPIFVAQKIGSLGYALERMNIFCYKGSVKDVAFLLKTLVLNIDIDEDDFNCYTGSSKEEVLKAQSSHKSIFSFNVFSHTKKRNIKLNAFNQTCIGIETSSEYTVILQQVRLDLSKLSLLVGGIIVFFLARKLSHNSAFFYLCGILLGVFASVLVLVWFASKLLPKKPLMYGALISGWALVGYFAQFLYENIYQILVVYQKYVMIYVVATSFISFGVCYYMGPPKSDRSKTLIKWSLQLLALGAIYLSSDFWEASVGIMTACFVLYYMPKGIPFFPFKRMWSRWFPPKPRLLTREEFEEVGRIETEKALKQLQEFVKSPDCKQWKVVMNLSQPSRFASFVENGDHVTLDETRLHEDTLADLSDDDENANEDDSDSSESFIDESVHVDQSVNLINKSKLRSLTNNLRKITLKSTFNKSKTSNLHTSTPTAPPMSNGRTVRSPRNGMSQRSINYAEMSDDED